ncbi:nuclear transport factor 2 family protein [Aquisediminimonas profunda]|uniref:nuclear transport factor 2 family protein n=1 Tax=Aquisediminimonas profunda TaxID=1550733 RepID=UPI001C6339EE|nr:nuclear transport factor 2 family protein [Aquisediminimonas profunda]
MTPEEKIAMLWERAQIETVMLDFGRALDLGDWPLYRKCFADRIRVDFERLTGFPEIEVDADAWTRFAELALGQVRRHHQYSNFAAKLEGERATAITYMVARHFKATDRGGSTNTQYGWYENSFQKLAGEWKIVRLSHQFQWVSGNDALFDFSEPALAAQMACVFCDANRVKQSGPADAP